MAVKKEKLRLEIPGLTNRDSKKYYTETSVYRANLDIKTFKKTISGFIIDDFWNTDLFNVTGDNIIRRRIVNDNDIERDSTFIKINKDNDSVCPFVVGEYYWIYNEVVLLNNVFDNGDSYGLNISRGQFGTINKIYKMNQYGDLQDGEEVYISNFKNDFNGLRVELYDLDDNLVEVGTIKEVTYTEGVIVIDCNNYLESLSVKIPEYKTEATETESAEDVDFYIDKMLTSFFGFWRYEYVGRNDISKNYNFYNKESDLFLYMDYGEFKLFISSLNGNFRSMLTRDSSISDYIKILEFISSKYIVFSGGRYRFLNLFNYYSTFEYNNQLESRNVHQDLSNIKYTTTRLIAPVKVEFEFNNRSLNVISNNKASIGNGTLSFKIGSDLKDDYVEEVTNLLDVSSLNYFRILDFAICELKIQTPYSMNKNKYIVGEVFNISDIDKFFTFERSSAKQFNIGIVIKNEGNDISILITKRIFFDPLIPSLYVSFHRFYEHLPDYKIILNIPKEIILPFTIDKPIDLSLTEKPPYYNRQYFEIGDDVVLDTIPIGGNHLDIISFNATIFELPSNISNEQYFNINVLVDSSTRDDIINNNREIIRVRYPDKGYENEFQSNFCKLDGGSLWV